MVKEQSANYHPSPPGLTSRILLFVCDALHDLINVKSTHGGVLLLVKLQAKSLHRCFLPFLNCTNGTKLCKTSHCLSVSYFYTVCLSYTVLTVYLSAERLLSFLPIFGEHVKFL